MPSVGRCKLSLSATQDSCVAQTREHDACDAQIARITDCPAIRTLILALEGLPQACWQLLLSAPRAQHELSTAPLTRASSCSASRSTSRYSVNSRRRSRSLSSSYRWSLQICRR